jgi:aryl-phospho-beta-D-glucosidase BglC (GH1 family)
MLNTLIKKGEETHLQFRFGVEMYEPTITTIDLSPYANMGFKDEVDGDKKGGWTDQGKENDLRMMPLGKRKFAGVEFNIIDPKVNNSKSCLVFAGPQRSYFLSSVKIALKEALIFKYLYLLHATAWTPSFQETVGTVKIFYQDGEVENLSIKTDRDVYDWWTPTSIENGVVGWTGNNEMNNVGLYVSRFELKRTGIPVTTIEITPTKKAVWMIVAMSVSSESIPIDFKKTRRQRPAQPASPAQIYKGHDLPRLRGVMVRGFFTPEIFVTEEDLRVLKEWNVNLIRWPLYYGSRGEPSGYDIGLERSMQHLDSLLPVCEEIGLKVVVDMHEAPGDKLFFKEKVYQDKFLQMWDKIARHYRGQKVIWGYDLLNEPSEIEVSERVMDWHTLATRAARIVRAIDSDHAIIIEPGRRGTPEGLDYFEPIPVPGVVYSVHMYKPNTFTHQGLFNNPIGLCYPGEIDGHFWDKEQLRKALQPVIDFQRDYGVHICIGEFSCIRWAPKNSAYNYIHDVIEIFEENGWDWTYHSFRGWNGGTVWSVEHSTDPKETSFSKTQTKREQLLRFWFDKNEKPCY